MHILYDIDQSYRQGNNNGIQYCPVHDTANANHYRPGWSLIHTYKCYNYGIIILV